MEPVPHRSQSQPRERATRLVSLAALAFVLVLGAPGRGTATPPVTRSGGPLLAYATGEPPFLGASCPCSGPLGGGVWRTHGQYLACVAKVTRHRARTSQLTAAEARRIRRDRVPTSCGTNRAGDGNVRVCAKNPVLPCPVVRTARVDDCAECDAALAGRLVRCARLRDASGAESDACGVRPLVMPGRGRVVEVRSGVDCASCRAKLGTPAPEGTDCVVAACGG